MSEHDDNYRQPEPGGDWGGGWDDAQPEPGSTGDAGYSAPGNVDGSSGQKNWQRIVGFGAIAAAAGMALLCVLGVIVAFLFVDEDVQVINAFDEPVELTVDGEASYEIGPRTLKTIEMEDGTRRLSASFADGQHIEDFEFDVPWGKDLVVYNIAGAAPAIIERVTYFDISGHEYQSGAYLEYEEDIDYLAGLRRYVRDDVDYIDEPPPEEIDMYGDREVRWAFLYEALYSDEYLDNALLDDPMWDDDPYGDDWTDDPYGDGLEGAEFDTDLDDDLLGDEDLLGDDVDLEEMGGLMEDFDYTIYLGPNTALDQLSMYHPDRLDDLIERLVQLDPTDPDYLWWVDSRAQEAMYFNDQPRRAADWIDLLAEHGQDHPDSIDLHTTIIDLKLEYGDQLDRTPPHQVYRQHHDNFDTETTALFAAYTSDDADEAMSHMQRVIDETDDPELRKLAYQHAGQLNYERGNCEEAIQYFEPRFALHDGADDEFDYDWTRTQDLTQHVDCMTRLDQHEEARAFLRDLADEYYQVYHYTDAASAELYGRVILTEDTGENPFALLEESSPWELDGYQIVATANSLGLLVTDRIDTELNEEYVRNQVDLNEALYDNPDRLLQWVRNTHTHADAGNQDIGFLLALLVAADNPQDPLFEDLYNFYFDFSIPADELGDATNNFQFDGDPPDAWPAPKRAAYYLVRALTTDNESKRETAADLAQQQTYLWGPMDGIAEAI